MDASHNMRESISLAEDILEKSTYVKFKRHNMLVERTGYKKYIVKRPVLKFGKDGKNSNLINNSVMFGLNAGGSYETKQINLDYFIDPSILNNKKARHSDIFF